MARFAVLWVVFILTVTLHIVDVRLTLINVTYLLKVAESDAAYWQVHKVKPETLKSILSLVQNADGRPIGGRSNTGAVDGSKASSLHGRETGSDDVTRDVIDDGSSAPGGDAGVVDNGTTADSRGRSAPASDSCTAAAASQDEQMRLASEGGSCAVETRVQIRICCRAK